MIPQLTRKAAKYLKKWNLEYINFEIVQEKLWIPDGVDLQGNRMIPVMGYYLHSADPNEREIKISYTSILELVTTFKITPNQAMLGILAHEAAHALDPQINSRNILGKELFASYYGAVLMRVDLLYRINNIFYWKVHSPLLLE